MVSNLIVDILIVLGTFFILLAAIGTLRFPDLYLRMHASTKASSLGLSLLLLGVIIKFPIFSIIIKSILIVLIIFITAPLAGHMISRVGHLLKVPKWKGTLKDDLDKIEDK
jgi:multicomponent Na+:H+ antiporter subunit G